MRSVATSSRTDWRGRISVVLATYNGERYLPEQLQSICRQERPPDEMVVVDDGSADTTPQVLRDFAASAPFPVHLHLRAEHRGTSATFEEGLRAATGDLLVICDQDDRWREDKVTVLSGAMACDPTALLGFSDARLIDALGRVRNRSRWRIAGFAAPQRRAMEADPLGQMVARQIVSGCTSALRAELLPALLPFPRGLYPAWPDMIYDRWASLMAAAVGPIALVDSPLVDYRIHPRQQVGIPKLPLRRIAPRTVLHLGQLVPGRAEMIQRIEFNRAHLEEIAKRLADAGLGTPESDRRLAQALRHLDVRRDLAPDRLRRAPPVVRELARRDGYRRFTLGFVTAVADVVR